MYRNRGELPNINRNNAENDTGRGYRAPHYSHFWNGRYIVVHYDKTFVAIELISILIILVIAFTAYLFGYKISFEDPIKTVKTTFLNAQLISIIIFVILTCLVTFLTKSKQALIRNLRVTAILSIITILVFLVIKINMDNKYNETTFGEFYEIYEQGEQKNNENSQKVIIGLSGIKLSDSKGAYVEESINAYTNFKVKTVLYLAIHIGIAIIVFYLSCRLSSKERKKEKLAKDDIVLFDDEENIKF